MILLWQLLDRLHALLALFLWPVRWTKGGRARASFEAKTDARQFRADWSFEVSSEGEFEQVRPWIAELLREGKQLEIVFASESVEKGILALQSLHPGQVRILRLPLLTYVFGAVERFLTAPHFVMCRYDFFPMLMAHAGRRGIKSGLVWASFKGRRARLNSALWRAYYRHFFSVFDWIIPATGDDEALFKLVHHNVLCAVDFRVGQIQTRVAARADVFQQKFSHWPQFRAVLERFPRDRRFVLGSAWESDLALLDQPGLRHQLLNGELLVMVVPHKLSDDWAETLSRHQLPVHHLSPALPFPSDSSPGVWLLNLKGILCELYAEVGKVYVGGGFERSIHSVLEPFVAGSEVWCGPKIHRSTEAELIRSVSPELFHVSDSHAELALGLAAPVSDAQGPDHRAHWTDNQAQRARTYIQGLKD